ncbi:MAG: hypothetical protein NEA02_16075 [Thermoanaerobaculia bacterium]|nr:hypothetical protein [Thermoanaerobaculia bacterium]
MRDEPGRPRTLSFDPDRRPGAGEVGCVHRDGSITYQGKRYRTLADVPASCIAFRADLPATVQWRKMYRAVDPKRPKG